MCWPDKHIAIKMYRTGSTFMERSSYDLPAIGFDAAIVKLRKSLVLQSPVRPKQLNKRFYIKNIGILLLFLASCVLASTTNDKWPCKLPESYPSTHRPREQISLLFVAPK